MDRVSTFKTFITRSPADPFPRYGLAMEYKGAGLLNEAWITFEELLQKFPDYVATYLMAGGTLIALGRTSEAAETFRKGVEVSGRRGDLHAKKELEAALAELASPETTQEISP
jgi:predicted Zn-dependent protease